MKRIKQERSHSHRRTGLAIALVLSLGLLAARGLAEAFTPVLLSLEPSTAQTGNDADSLANMSLEDLMNVEVTSVSKYKQKASEAPAAVTVITQDDIGHSGLHSIPELLRLAPGMSVARMDSNGWAISSRGFNMEHANKLLVLMNGRTVYAPLVSGVVWDQQGYLLQDLDRIEVIRGPGATMWGANAVNGVINITTKSAKETQGALVTGLGSNVDNQVGLRYGGKAGADTYYRVFGMFSKTEEFSNAAGDGQFDGWQSMRGGFRVDRFASPKDMLTLEGDAYETYFGERDTLPIFAPPFAVSTEGTHHGSGMDILGRWTHTVSPDSEYSVQLYYDRLYRTQNVLTYLQHTFDAELQHHFALGDRQSIIWGFGARYLVQQADGTDVVSFDPADRDDYRLNLFFQDDIAIVPERVHFIVGSKFEYTSYSGLEYQPSARLLWTPNERHTVWAAVSRAVHTPTPSEQDGTTVLATFPGEGGIPAGLVLGKNADQESEQLIAYELGYRLKPAEQVSLDFAAFFNHYEGLRSFETGAPVFQPTPTPRVIIPGTAGNGLDADSYGIEAGVNVNVTPDWRVSASYSFLNIDTHVRSSSNDSAQTLQIEGSSPRNQAQLHSYYRLTRSLDVNASAYYVETLPALDVPSYIRIDLGLTWRPREDLELTVGVQNLCDDGHQEFGPGYFSSSAGEMPRTIYGQMTWQF